MSLHADLIAQARMLAHHEPRRPKQASLRRAISTAYYALFHTLVADAAARLARGQKHTVLRARISRRFTHADMRTAAQAVVARRSPWVPVPSPELLMVADAIVLAQETRHLADYDVGARFRRHEASAVVRTVADARLTWQAIRERPEAEAFLLAVLFRGA